MFHISQLSQPSTSAWVLGDGFFALYLRRNQNQSTVYSTLYMSQNETAINSALYIYIYIYICNLMCVYMYYIYNYIYIYIIHVHISHKTRHVMTWWNVLVEPIMLHHMNIMYILIILYRTVNDIEMHVCFMFLFTKNEVPQLQSHLGIQQHINSLYLHRG